MKTLYGLQIIHLEIFVLFGIFFFLEKHFFQKFFMWQDIVTLIELDACNSNSINITQVLER